MNSIGFSKNRNDAQRGRSMMKFGMFASSIPDPNDSECSTFTPTEGTHQDLKKFDKGNAQVD